MQGVFLKIYVSEQQKHDGVLLYEWLLEEAKKLGIHGGSAFRAIAGFGRHGVLREESFFELAGNLPVEVSFLVNEAEVERLLALLARENLRLFHVRMKAEYGVTGES